MSGNPSKSKKSKKGKKGKRIPQYRRKRGRKTSTNNEELLKLLKPEESDVMKLLAAQTHIGRRRANVNMKRYIWKRRQDGINVINLDKTWAKLILASRILVTVREPSDICVMSTRTYGQRGAIKFAHYTGATALVGKWVPGTFTNPQNKAFFEPRIIIVDDPSTCFAALRETSYVGIPVIALCGTDNNTRFVDCAIPCNNRGKLSIGLMFWLLARELLRMRGDSECIRKVPWKESVDLFFYRDADEIKRQQDAKLLKQQRAAKAMPDYEPQDDVELIPQYDDQNAGFDQPYDAGMADRDWGMPETGIEDWGGQNDAVQAQDQGGYVEQYDPAQPQQYEEQGGQAQAQPPPQGMPQYEEQQQVVDPNYAYQGGQPPQQQQYDEANQGGMQMRQW